jgi:hypothetical protein
MADTKKAATGQTRRGVRPRPDPSTASASRDPDSKLCVDLLANILGQVQKQVQSTTPKPLEPKALEAVDLFRKIAAALALQLCPAITLLGAYPPKADKGDPVKLKWTSTDAQTVSIVSTRGQHIGPVPAAQGEIIVTLTDVPESFKATATGPCCETESNSVTVDRSGT